MRLCLVGKFPPIQGGVSARMYRLAHALARRGHQVHVVTNAMEVEDGYRVSMRPEDYDRLAARHVEGYVRVHQTVSDVRGQWHVPWHNPYATKLAGLAIDVIRNHELECVFSWYLETYGMAGHLAASFTGTPHVMKTAGSDVGRLWHQPGMRLLYDELFLIRWLA
jgi:glycosyltransferase involved in cell wall biosynthesis